MVDIFFIFGAKYLYLICVALAAAAFLLLRREEQRRMVLLACIALPLAYIIAVVSAHFYFDPRPFVAGNFTPLIPHAPDNGFPSDHTLLTASIAALFFPFRRSWGLGFFALAGVVAVSRVYVGVHHATDVLGSMIIVLVSVGASYWFLRELRGRHHFSW